MKATGKVSTTPLQGGRFQPSSQWGNGYTGHLGEKRGLNSKVLLQWCFFLRSKINVCLLYVGRSVFPKDNHLMGLGKDEPAFQLLQRLSHSVICMCLVPAALSR